MACGVRAGGRTLGLDLQVLACTSSWIYHQQLLHYNEISSQTLSGCLCVDIDTASFNWHYKEEPVVNSHLSLTGCGFPWVEKPFSSRLSGYRRPDSSDVMLGGRAVTVHLHRRLEWKCHSANMEFLKSLVPTVISGDGGLPATDAGGVWPRETGPRLLRMKRLVSQANEEEQDVSGLTSRPAVRLQRYRAKGTSGKKKGWVIKHDFNCVAERGLFDLEVFVQGVCLHHFCL